MAILTNNERPPTEAGINRSKLNAVTHGMRAETLVLLDEDPQALEDRRAAWIDSLMPADDVERRIVEDAVMSTWQLDRARRAQIARLNLNILNHGVDQAQTNEEEVQELGRRLFNDRLGPLAFYPTGCDYDEMDGIRRESASFDDKEDDLDRPGLLVLRLQATLLGCEWLLGQWAALKAILDRGQPWLSSDKFKAVRLLGKQPFDAIDDRDVALVFLASFVLKEESGRWYLEIATEMTESDIRKFRHNAADRQLNLLKPENATKARDALLGIIECATEHLTSKADAHRVRAELQAALAANLLAFDDSPEGERLRRYELSHGRGVVRALDSLQKHHRNANRIDRNVATGAIAESDILEQAHAMTEKNTTNEPTAACENLTNEPTVASDVGPDGPTYVKTPTPNATNEPTGAYENVTNEPAVAYEIVTNEPTLAGYVGPSYMNAPTQNATIEATDDCENVTNEATDAYKEEGQDLNGSRIKITSRIMNDDPLHNSDFHEEIDRQKSLEWIRAGSARMAEIRAEMLRKLNEKGRREAKEGNTGRRSWRERNENGNPLGRPQTQAEGIDPRMEGTNPARTVGDSAELVNAGSAVTVRAGPT